MRILGWIAVSAFVAAMVSAQPPQGPGGRGPQSENVRAAQQAIRDGKDADALAAVRKELAANPASMPAASLLDTLGQTGEAKKVYQKAIDGAADPAAKANAQRSIAMSYAFDGDCRNTIKFEQMVIDYWVTREAAEPQNAFYQEGEMANEAARVCIDAGDLESAETWYRKGTEMGIKEPGNQTHPKSLWEFRLQHGLARIAARRGNKVEAEKLVASARKILDSDTAMAAQQERFYPYLMGYVALYTGDFAKAEAEMTKALAAQGNQNDPFYHCLLGMALERQGQGGRAMEMYRKAYSLAMAHNPPAAYARPFARKKLAMLEGKP
jgi:tetratricopeptide (TPR) repeat protein